VDIPFIVLTLLAALFLPRPRALLATVALWAVAVAMVGWGPAHSDNVPTASLEFWVPWSAALAVGLLLVLGVAALRARRGRGPALPAAQNRGGSR
jgi:hypothetical protein